MSAEVLGSGKVAVVTGGGSGIGRSLCERFAVRGMSVVVADTAAGDSTASALREGSSTVSRRSCRSCGRKALVAM